MSNNHLLIDAPESPATVAPLSKPQADAARHQSEQIDTPTNLVCALSAAKAFCEDFYTPHVPVAAAFGGERLHVCRLNGSFDLDQAVAENHGALYRSIRILPSKSAKDITKEWDDLTFQFGPRVYLYADKNRIVAFASTPDEAERLVSQFGKAYNKPKPATPHGGIFHLIQQEGNDIRCKAVTLSLDTILDNEKISLHYGGEGKEWHQEFIGKLQEKSHGLTIFEGSPGTGKTCYLRHLMGELQESHRFYFIPTSNLGVLSRSDFIGLWADQRRHYSDRKFAVVLEDSDSALMTRGSDNREQVSAILNLSDGMLADFLRLQIICTINCTAADIDQALLRPGRLLCHRVFGKLDYTNAARLAVSLGKQLPVVRDYSLAEIFNGHDLTEISHPRIGFDA